MFCIGLTGGIGTGKSTVSAYLARLGYRIIDADKISHQVTAPGSPLLPRIEEAFGSCVMTEKGELDRQAMAALVFADPEKKALLESIVTAEVKHIIEARKQELKAAGEKGLVFFDIPLLFEYGCEGLCDAVWTVSAEEEVRIRRVMARDGAVREHVLARIASQMPQEEKESLADEVIDNSGDLAGLYDQIDALLERYAGLQE